MRERWRRIALAMGGEGGFSLIAVAMPVMDGGTQVS